MALNGKGEGRGRGLLYYTLVGVIRGPTFWYISTVFHIFFLFCGFPDFSKCLPLSKILWYNPYEQCTKIWYRISWKIRLILEL